MIKAKNIKIKHSDYDKMTKEITKDNSKSEEGTSMKTVVHKAHTRGHANHGWLDSWHSFSFAGYHNPKRVRFGVLRVLNDDTVAPDKGFGTHPHDNMEIISIPLEGDLEHRDSMGNTSVIKAGDIQVMSAGTGIFHSEYNKNADADVKFLQIWIFPREKNLAPRYDQMTIKDVEEKNKFYQILSPYPDDQGVWIHQDAWFHLGTFEKGIDTHYHIKKNGNGVYAFVIEGDITVAGEKLSKRDGLGIWNADTIAVRADSNAKILLMEVPMEL